MPESAARLAMAASRRLHEGIMVRRSRRRTSSFVGLISDDAAAGNQISEALGAWPPPASLH